jgi:hypothetical protein
LKSALLHQEILRPLASSKTYFNVSGDLGVSKTTSKLAQRANKEIECCGNLLTVVPAVGFQRSAVVVLDEPFCGKAKDVPSMASATGILSRGMVDKVFDQICQKE